MSKLPPIKLRIRNGLILRYNREPSKLVMNVSVSPTKTSEKNSSTLPLLHNRLSNNQKRLYSLMRNRVIASKESVKLKAAVLQSVHNPPSISRKQSPSLPAEKPTHRREQSELKRRRWERADSYRVSERIHSLRSKYISRIPKIKLADESFMDILKSFTARNASSSIAEQKSTAQGLTITISNPLSQSLVN